MKIMTFIGIRVKQSPTKMFRAKKSQEVASCAKRSAAKQNPGQKVSNHKVPKIDSMCKQVFGQKVSDHKALKHYIHLQMNEKQLSTFSSYMHGQIYRNLYVNIDHLHLLFRQNS